MTVYDRQTIVQHEPNPADAVIPTGSANLEKLGKSKNIPTMVVELPIAGQPGQAKKQWKLVDAISKMTVNSRLYIRGHGEWTQQTIGGVDANTWANTLLNAGFSKSKIISITACCAGRDRHISVDVHARVAQSADSFASQFHRALMDIARLNTVIYARVYNQIVCPPGFKATSDLAEGIFPANSRAKSKLKFSWQGGKQFREWVKYEDGENVGTSSLGDLPENEWI